MQHATDVRPGDLASFRQLGKTLPSLPATHDGGLVENDGSASDVSALEFRSAHAGKNSLDDQVAFQLGDDTYDHDDSPTYVSSAQALI